MGRRHSDTQSIQPRLHVHTLSVYDETVSHNRSADNHRETDSEYSYRWKRVNKGHKALCYSGPVTEDALGVEVTATLVEHDRAELHADAIKPPVEETGTLKDSFSRETHAQIGKIFSADIDEVTDDGHGLIYTRTEYIDLGPVTGDAKGEYVHALKLPGNAARVKSAKVQPDNYIDKLESTFNFGFSLDFGDAGDVLGKRNHKTFSLFGYVESPDSVGIHCFTAHLML